MSTTEKASHTSKCLRCGRTLRAASSRSAGYGRWCRAKIRAAIIADALKGQFKGVVVLGGTANNAVALVATVAPELSKQVQAGKIIQAIAPIVGGKGGGRPDNARGGGKDASRLDEALSKALRAREWASRPFTLRPGAA